MNFHDFHDFRVRSLVSMEHLSRLVYIVLVWEGHNYNIMAVGTAEVIKTRLCYLTSINALGTIRASRERPRATQRRPGSDVKIGIQNHRLRIL